MSDEYTGRRMELRPHLDRSPAYYVFWDRDACRHTLEALHSLSSQEIDQRIRAFEENARLTLDERGPGFADSLGEWRPVPDGTARLVAFNFQGRSHGTPGNLWLDNAKWLLFLDGDGRVVLLVPNYGWNNGDLEPWAHAAGWDTEISMAFFEGDELAREKAYPGFNTAPRVPIGGPYFVPEPLTDRVRRRFRLRR